ncbi:MAG: HDOD domain-containing protein [Verrucomicrobiota bacterium]
MSNAVAESEFLQYLFPRQEIDERFRIRLLDVLQHDPDFPTFPTALAKIQTSLSHPDTGFDKIAELIKLDPGITAKIFTLIHSAAYGGVQVSSIEEALWRLGIKETRAVVLSRRFMVPFSHLKVKLDWTKFWIHSLLSARLTQSIADFFQPAAEKEYLAGLLHDTGKLILAHYFPERFKNILQEAETEKCRIHKIENKILGTDHASIGAALCHRWKLHNDIVSAVQFHHTSKLDLQPTLLSKCLRVADKIANLYAENIQEKALIPYPEDVTQTHEWQELHDIPPRRPVLLSIKEECDKTRDIVKTMLDSKAEAPKPSTLKPSTRPKPF